MLSGKLNTPEAQIFLLSFIMLFGEVMAVRWLGMEMALMRAFPNLIIMVVLVASSAGLAAASSQNLKRISAPWLAVVSLVLFLPCLFALPLGLPFTSIKLEGSVSSVAIGLSTLFAMVVTLYLLFRELGITLGAAFDKLPALKAYSINLLGSILGVVAFALISLFSLPPWTWIILLGITCFLALRNKLIIALTVVLAATAFFTTSKSMWSPYSKLDVLPLPSDSQQLFGSDNYVLNSNDHYFHFAVKILDPQQQQKLDSITNPTTQQKTIQKYYQWLSVPLQFAPKHDSVLVLGAGSGNDVAFALSKGATKVHAVEIDPIIAQLGRQIHPNKPYADPRVVLHNDDARTFLRYSKDKFDLIEFAYLDPGSTINTSSFLRVDNYVYTVEAMKGALNLLNDDGVVSVTFASGADNLITRRLYQTISTAWGQPPIGYVDKSWDSCLFLFGPGVKKMQFPETVGELRRFPNATDNIQTAASTDDWPFLYLEFESGAMFLYFGTLFIAVVLPGLLLTKAKGGAISGGEWGNMFFLGQAFMLIETKSITQLSLLFGATWVVSSVVIAVVLILAYLATLFVMRFQPKNVHLLYGALLVALVFEYFFRVPVTGGGDPMSLAIIASLVTCLPILFGSTIFSVCFRNAASPANYLSANLLGVAIGGITENLCIVMGLKNLSLVAALLYGLSYVCILLARKNK